MVRNIKVLSLIAVMTFGLFSDVTLIAGSKRIVQHKGTTVSGHVIGDIEIVEDPYLYERFFSWFKSSRLDKIAGSPLLLSSAGLALQVINIGKNWKELMSVGEVTIYMAVTGVIPGWGQLFLGTWCGYVFVTRLRDLPDNLAEELQDVPVIIKNTLLAPVEATSAVSKSIAEILGLLSHPEKKDCRCKRWFKKFFRWVHLPETSEVIIGPREEAQANSTDREGIVREVELEHSVALALAHLFEEDQRELVDLTGSGSENQNHENQDDEVIVQDEDIVDEEEEVLLNQQEQVQQEESESRDILDEVIEDLRKVFPAY